MRHATPLLHGGSRDGDMQIMQSSAFPGNVQPTLASGILTAVDGTERITCSMWRWGDSQHGG
jgi:hypothetical protein